jgi:hypothetical protein
MISMMEGRVFSVKDTWRQMESGRTDAPSSRGAADLQSALRGLNSTRNYPVPRDVGLC